MPIAARGGRGQIYSDAKELPLTLACPICASVVAEELEFRPEVPIAQNLMFRSREEALACPTGTLRIVRCMSCGFAWNTAFDPGLLRYDADYENDQSASPSFGEHLDWVARRIASRMNGRHGIAALEVGCGQGDFLRRLSKVLGARTGELTGFDPAYRTESAVPAGTRIERTYFTRETSARLRTAPDLVVARHIIEHVPDPRSLLHELRSVCAPGVPLFIETPDLQWILDGAVAHDLYYEHCSLFDAGSLRFALEAAGFLVEDLRPCFGGQYLLATAIAAEGLSPALPRSRPSSANYPQPKAVATRAVAASLARDAARGHTIAFWGGASKAVTLALLLGEAIRHVSMAIDINPGRSGTFMPVSGLPVVAPEVARAAGVTKAYVLNPQYLAEIESFCRERAWPLALTPIE